ncbi:DUF2382 domain-containing protein [Diaminobutyricimonas aerilata]|nr:PRC and DUF2382 domain-containing protein [Diaminobutyricimonas aerilata]
MLNTDSPSSLIGSTVYDRDHSKIGSVEQIYVDPGTERPLFAAVTTGLFGTSQTFVPLEAADQTDDGIVVPYEKSFVKDAPRIEPEGALDPSEENALYDYYGLSGADSSVSGGSSLTDGVDTTTTGYSDTVGHDTGTVGHDTSGPNTDDAMTRSEEQLHVGTERVQTGSARLRKYVVTENETVTVPVTREEVRLEREPITDANVGDALSGPDLSEEEHEVTLTEERVVVDKETVPVERVRLDKETVTEQQQVDETVRKEQIEFDGDADTRR